MSVLLVRCGPLWLRPPRGRSRAGILDIGPRYFSGRTGSRLMAVSQVTHRPRAHAACMSENDKPGDETQPVRRQGGPDPAPAPAAQPAPEPAPAPTGSASESGPAPDPGPATSDPTTGSRFRRWRNQQRGDRTFGLAAL